MWIRSVLAAMALFFSVGTVVQAQHEGDVEFEYDGGKIIIDGGVLSTTGPADRFFEGAFGTGGMLNGFTADPGFESHEPIGPGDAIGFNIHSFNGNFLHYFDPLLGTLSSAHTKSLTLDWLGPGSLTINRTAGGSGSINVANASGVFHSHLSGISLTDTTPSDYGAYGFLMSLSTNAVGVTESDAFWMVFNYGMDEEDFENSLSSFNITAVPEPSAFILVALAACGLGLRRKRSEFV